MNTKHLDYFRKVAETEHITRAANELHIAQPALSKTIRTLESEFGSPLFNHVGRNITLNSNGKILLKYASLIDAELTALHQELEQNRCRINQSVSILLRTTPVFVVKLITQFRSLHPDIAVNLITYNRNVNTSENVYDFVIDSTVTESVPENSVLLATERMMLAVSKTSPLFREDLTVADIEKEEFINLPLIYRRGKEIQELCKACGFNPNISLQTSDYNTIQELVANDFGVAVIPEYAWGFHRNPQLAIVPVKGLDAKYTTTLNYFGSAVPTSVAALFRDFSEELAVSGKLEIT